MEGIGNAGEERFSSGGSAVEPRRLADPLDYQDWHRVAGDNASKRADRVALVVRTFLSLSVSVALACNAAHAQRPKSPVVLTGNGGPPSGVLFKETFERMPIGRTQDVFDIDGEYIWRRGTAPGDCCTIADSSPVFSGAGKYYHPGPVAKNGELTFRTEYWYLGTPKAAPLTSLGTIGGIYGQYVGQIYWYGYVFCLDQYTGSEGERIHFNQWHDDAPGEFDPMVSLFGNGQTLHAYIEHSQEPPGGDSFTSPVLYTNHLGNCINVIWQIRFDTRLASQGSTGLIRLWLDALGVNNSTPKFEWVDKQVANPTGTPSVSTGLPGAGINPGGQPFWTMGGYLSSWRWSGTEGQIYEARYDNFTIMDSTGSYAAMLAALNTP